MIRVKQMLKWLPNTITLLNLLSGCLSITAAYEGKLELAAMLIILSAVFDFLDGFVARMVGAYSELGKQLDSLSDVVSFGVAPAVIVYHLMRQSLGTPSAEGIFDGHWLLVVPFFIAMMSALRLGIFNLDVRQTESFIGLPTPANALFMVGLVFGLNSSWSALFGAVAGSWVVLVLLSVGLSLLLVSELPMFSLKIKTLNPKIAYKQLVLIIGAAAILAVFGRAALSPIILWYILLSLGFWLFERGGSSRE